ncbi:MAG: acetate/propionate family kinase [Proteobacteria bacterium]|nr:acetate/propionate family kinase [Pseudomonadota bacterium]
MCSTKHSNTYCTVLTVNSGSTSVKLAAFSVGAGTVTQISHEHLSGEKLVPQEVLCGFLARLPSAPQAIAHRVVHGGHHFSAPVRIDAQVLRTIGELSELAPLHNPKALEWIEAARAVAGADVAQVAAFDTSFFTSLPRVAGEYALAPKFGVQQDVRRYGFHGLAHQALWQRWLQLRPELPRGGKLITLQLGGGASITAIDRGQPLDTSMGFSPLEGLVMGTRTGDVDPAVVPHLQARLGKTSEEIISLLNRESGVAGLSGGETNLGTLAADPDPQSQFTVDLYCYRARKYIGAYLTVLGGCDGIVFGGGVGEHVPAVRQRIVAGLGWAGIELDGAANDAARGQEARIDSAQLPVRVQVIPVEEEGVLVRAAVEILGV